MTTILVIEDDFQIRKMIRIMLENNKYDVFDAFCGSKGLELCKEHRIDIVITDIIMNNIDGIEVITQVKKDYPNIKIIAISGGGYVDPSSNLNLADTLGADYTLPKPFEMQHLLTCICKLLS